MKMVINKKKMSKANMRRKSTAVSGPQEPNEHDSKLKRNSSFSDYDTDSKKDVGEESDTSDNKEKPKEPITLKKVIVRSLTASFLALLYLSIVYAGHFYCILAVILTQTELYREIVNVRYVEARERAMPKFRTLQWGWFFVAMVLVCKSFIYFLSFP
jgi:phosphatidate cytidylyltransferase